MPALKRTETGLWTARKVIPADVRGAYGKREEKKTWPAALTQGQAKAEYTAWLTPIEERIDSLRAAATQTPVTLTQRQCRALAGEWYKLQVARFEENAGQAEDWAFSADDLVPKYEEELEADRIKPTDWLVEECEAFLRDKGLRLTAASIDALLQDMGDLWFDLCRLMERRAQGDYGPDPLEGTLPAFDAAPQDRTPAVSILGLFEDYASTGSANERTLGRWRNVVRGLVEYLGHDDALKVTRSDGSAWLASLVKDGLSVKTVRGAYRAAPSRIFKRAVDTGKLPSNPFERLEVVGPKPTETRRKDISDDEARTILSASLGAQPEGISEAHARARRWVPWICAYTGARVNEITQLRAMDIRQEEGVWVFRITPEAGSVKDHKARSVPIHSHLIEQGITALAKAGSDAPLFYEPRPDGGSKTNPPSAQMGGKLASWVRSLGVTEVQSPNHGWRHRFKTQARRVGIPEDVRDAIQGHAPKSQGQAYGGWPMEALRAGVEKLERY